MTEFPISGATAVITGAGSGIGAALAHALAARGAHLALVDRDAAGLTATKTALEADVRASLHVMDVSDAQACADLPHLVEDVHGAPADILVNNAGVALGGTFTDVSADEFNWLLEINLMAPIRLTRAVLPMLQARPAGHIVNLSSLFGLIAPPGQVAYCTSKFGLRGFSEALRHELIGTGVGVTVVHPGGVATSIARNARIAGGANMTQDRLSTIEAKLTLPPARAGEIIAAAIAARKKRVLVGRDAKIIDMIQRVLPSGYWSVIAKQFSA
jgi:short-subunit dehydrogenase